MKTITKSPGKITILVLVILLICIAVPVSADVVISNTSSQSTITWSWTGTPSGISNLTIDSMEVCGIDPGMTSFVLTGLDALSTHEIIIKYLGNDTSQLTTTTNATYSVMPVTLDPGTSTDWNIWILSGVLGLILFLISLRGNRSGDDIIVNAIISVIAWLPIGFCAYSSFNVSRITTETGFKTLYSYGTIGILMYIFLAVAILNTVRLIALHRVFNGSDQE
jgi:hypothetical protein